MLSDILLTPQIERNVIAAFKELHSYGVAHGDIRAANIMVRPDESVVIIDFERSVLNCSRIMLIEEEDEVRYTLQIARSKKNSV